MGSEGLRTLLVGLDAACGPVLERLSDDDAVPTLDGLLAAGERGPLESQIPPWTPSAWPSIYTGTNPGKHGVFDFLSFDGYDWEVVNATHVRERTLWELLDLHDRSSVVVNAPVTHPPRPFDGALVPGYVAPEDPDCHPEGLLAELRDAIGGYRVYPRGDAPVTDRYTEVVRMRGAAFRHLVDRFRPDFGFLQFQVTDTVFHEQPEDGAVREVYATVDDEIGAVLEDCDPTNVLVVSDHGMGEVGGHEFRANEFLRDAGYVEAVRGGEGMPTWSTVRDGQLKRAAAADPDAAAGPGSALVAAAARVGVTSQRVGAALERVGLADAVAARVPDAVVRAGSEQVDFADSDAYARSRTECGVRINLEGREPAGTVPPDEYEAVRRELIERLSAVRTPEGDPVFETVARREAYFGGPEADRAVDVVTVPAGFDHLLSTTLAGDQFGPPSEPWNHKRDGIVAVTGPAAERCDLSGAHVFDVAPTVLATFGLAADERMDGTSLVEDAGVRAYPAFDPGSAVRASPDEGAVEERLADLGYLE
jgi:predicted AlkP superfamily phosphohydrolase/phosphomutase